MSDRRNEVLRDKKLALFEQLLSESDHLDTTLIGDLTKGFDLTGELPKSGVFARYLRPAKVSCDNLRTFATISRESKVTCRLIEFGADLNSQAPPLPRSWMVSPDEHRDPWWAGQETALHFASGRGHLHTVHLLITYKAHLNVLDGRGRSWLQVATGSVSVMHQAFLATTPPELTDHSR
eukprot:Skav230271  [mRNA]  locus=scaffold3387:389583:390119:+ [translate_table: standard]